MNFLICDPRLDFDVESEPEHVQEFEVPRIVDDELEFPVDLFERQDGVLLDEVLGEELDVDHLADARRAEVDVLVAVLLGQALGDLVFFGEAEFDDDIAQALAGPGRDLARLLNLSRRQKPPAHQYVTKLLS
jgi:hypothetical protein